MSEQERADRLVRAIDDLIQGHLPGDLADDDLEALLRIARTRLDAARSSSHLGIPHEGAVWQQVMAGLGHLSGTGAEPTDVTDPTEHAGELAAIDDPEELSIQELQEVIGLRRQMTERAASLGEPHREAIWQEVAARLLARAHKRGIFSVLRRPEPEVELLASAVDRLIADDAGAESYDSKMEALLQLAHVRKALGHAATAASVEPQARVWARVRPRLLAHLLGADQRRHRVFLSRASLWPKLAAAAAVLALLAAGLGPLPVTGLADHPAARVIRFVGQHVGVLETSAPPELPPLTTVVAGVDVSTAQASDLLEAPARDPGLLPTGFQRTSSKFFPQAITAPSGGVFLQAFSRDAAASEDRSTILIYQERAGGVDIAVRQGSAAQFTLADGTPATYVDGSWQPQGSYVVWGDYEAQTLVFDRAGLRTIIHYIDGPRMDPHYLAAIAESMAPSPVP